MPLTRHVTASPLFAPAVKLLLHVSSVAAAHGVRSHANQCGDLASVCAQITEAQCGEPWVRRRCCSSCSLLTADPPAVLSGNRHAIGTKPGDAVEPMSSLVGMPDETGAEVQDRFLTPVEARSSLSNARIISPMAREVVQTNEVPIRVSGPIEAMPGLACRSGSEMDSVLVVP